MSKSYSKEYLKYHRSARMKRERALRNHNRRAAIRDKRVRKGDGREIDHLDGNPTNNAPGNLRVVSRRLNRKKQ